MRGWIANGKLQDRNAVYQPMGGSDIGNDEIAMVDPQLRVREMQGLRVIDASLMPALTGDHANGPTINDPERRRI
jgi:choline dehydrogenase-like flavoprotein